MAAQHGKDDGDRENQQNERGQAHRLLSPATSAASAERRNAGAQ
jgi:hypothetical protein